MRTARPISVLLVDDDPGDVLMIEEALESGRIDLAVHSLKDLPTQIAPQFTLAAIPKRADARDVWVCEPYWALHTLPEGGKVGTTSPRRRAQLLALRPDLEFVEIRGNIDTRLKKLEKGDADALVLAAAGLDRLKSGFTSASRLRRCVRPRDRERWRLRPGRSIARRRTMRMMSGTPTFAGRLRSSSIRIHASASMRSGPC